MKNFYSNQSSKNSSGYRLNFPILSHKGSESQNRERSLDLSILPFYADTQSGTECSSIGRFFKHADMPNTTRAASHSYKMPNIHKPHEPCIQSPRPMIGPDQVWEIAERLDTYKLKAESSHFLPLTQESLDFKASLWKNCASEILTVIKFANISLCSSLSNLFSKIFQLFEEFEELKKAKSQENLEKYKDMSAKIKRLQKDLLLTQQENAQLKQVKRFDEEKIKKEIEELFPNNEEEIKRLKEQSIMLRNTEGKNVPETLEKICNEMQVDENIPEETQLDLEQFNGGEIYLDMKERYKFVVSRTVKHVKGSIKKTDWSIKEVQTEEPFIDYKVVEEAQKQVERVTLTHQATLKQVDMLKEVNHNKALAIEKLENDKSQIRNEMNSARREVEVLQKENQNLKSENDSKKIDLFTVRKLSDEKSVKISELENKVAELKNKITVISEKQLNLGYELEKYKNRQPSEAVQVVSQKEEVKKSKLDEVTKSGLTVREELEKAYASKFNSTKKSELLDVPQEAAGSSKKETVEKLGSEEAGREDEQEGITDLLEERNETQARLKADSGREGLRESSRSSRRGRINDEIEKEVDGAEKNLLNNNSKAVGKKQKINSKDKNDESQKTETKKNSNEKVTGYIKSENNKGSDIKKNEITNKLSDIKKNEATKSTESRTENNKVSDIKKNEVTKPTESKSENNKVSDIKKNEIVKVTESKSENNKLPEINKSETTKVTGAIKVDLSQKKETGVRNESTKNEYKKVEISKKYNEEIDIQGPSKGHEEKKTAARKDEQKLFEDSSNYSPIAINLSKEEKIKPENERKIEKNIIDKAIKPENKAEATSDFESRKESKPKPISKNNEDYRIRPKNIETLENDEANNSTAVYENSYIEKNDLSEYEVDKKYPVKLPTIKDNAKGISNKPEIVKEKESNIRDEKVSEKTYQDLRYNEHLKKNEMHGEIEKFANKRPINSITSEDKCTGSDFPELKCIGVQVNMNKKSDDPPVESATYFLPYNPNNVYGLRGDVYYQKSVFQPQARIPDLNSSILFNPPYKIN